MAIGVRILSDNLSGLTTNVTYLPESGGTVDLGVQTFPFNYISDYYFGTYNCYVPTYATTYSVEVPIPEADTTPTSTETPTPTVTPSSTSWNYCHSLNEGFNNQAEAAIEDSEGKIIFVGLFTAYSGVSFNRIIRLNNDGSIDNTFNVGEGFDNSVFDVQLQSDGKILLGGQFNFYDGSQSEKIVRLNTDGTIDNTFNTGTGFDGLVYVIKVQTDGKILVGGGFTEYNGTAHRNLIRLNSDGSVDNSFNAGSGFDRVINDIILLSDGKKVVLGDFTTVDGNSKNGIVRLNDDGSIDNSFITGNGFNGTVYSGLLDGTKLVVVGAFYEYDGQINRQIVRLNYDGSIDDTFNSESGFNRLSGLTYSTTVRKYTNKYFIIGDFDTYNNVSAHGLIQLNEDGGINYEFNYGTGLVFSANTFNTGIILSNGVHVVFGEFSEYNGDQVSDIAFINPFGTLLNCPRPTQTPTTTPSPTPTL